MRFLPLLLLAGCLATTPTPVSVNLPTPTPTCPPTYPHKIGMLEYCTIKSQQQLDYAELLNTQPECPHQDQFLLHAFQTGVLANEYEIDAYCQGMEEGHEYQYNEAQYTALHQICQPENKAQNYKTQATQQLATLLEENTCILQERTEAAFNVGYYCPAHSPEFSKWKVRYITGFVDACVLGHNIDYITQCREYGEQLYLRIGH